MRIIAVAAAVLIACGGGGGDDGDDGDDQPGPDAPPIPGGGIAEMYPGDVGIAGDPRVLFADDFESYGDAGDLDTRWDAVYQAAQLRIETTPANVFAGAQSVEMTAPQQSQELSNTVGKVLTAEQDVLYLRYYSKYESTFDITGSSHNGGDISAHYFINGQATPGIPADGTNKFLVSYENWRGEVATTTPGDLNVYVYHPEQRSNYGDHFFPNGDVMPNTSIPHNFGGEFVERTNLIQDLDRWYAYELMVRANTPGMRDGRITCWLDGVIIADFPNIRFRDIPTLTIDRFALSLHFGSNPTAETRKWYDNVVAATEYIGPMAPP